VVLLGGGGGGGGGVLLDSRCMEVFHDLIVPRGRDLQLGNYAAELAT